MGQKLMSIDDIRLIEYQFEECFEDDNVKKIQSSLTFLESLNNQFEVKRWLSPKQMEALKEIHERATS